MSMEEKQNQNAGQPENKAKIEPVIRKDRQLCMDSSSMASQRK